MTPHPEILQVGHPTLRAKAKRLTQQEILSEDIQNLIETMKGIMHQAPGVGLAAPQIGHSLQIIVINDRPEYTQGISKDQLELRERAPVPFHVVINPTLHVNGSERAEFFEGCLSAAGFVGVVPRMLTVQVECLNERAEHRTIEARGWYARILQHEIDHLHGVLCVDKMKIRTMTTVENYQAYWKDLPVAEACQELGA